MNFVTVFNYLRMLIFSIIYVCAIVFFLNKFTFTTFNVIMSKKCFYFIKQFEQHCLHNFNVYKAKLSFCIFIVFILYRFIINNIFNIYIGSININVLLKTKIWRK